MHKLAREWSGSAELPIRRAHMTNLASLDRIRNLSVRTSVSFVLSHCFASTSMPQDYNVPVNCAH